MLSLNALSVAELLALHARIGETLHERGVVRSTNNPAGDLAEYLFCRAFGWRQAPNSQSGYDATGADGKRYQIKGRRIHQRNKSRQLSAMRHINDRPFDVLAAVLFKEDFKVCKAALIPIEVVRSRSTFVELTNSYKFMLLDDMWRCPGVCDATQRVAEAMG